MAGVVLLATLASAQAPLGGTVGFEDAGAAEAAPVDTCLLATVSVRTPAEGFRMQEIVPVLCHGRPLDTALDVEPGHAAGTLRLNVTRIVGPVGATADAPPAAPASPRLTLAGVAFSLLWGGAKAGAPTQVSPGRLDADEVFVEIAFRLQWGQDCSDADGIATMEVGGTMVALREGWAGPACTLALRALAGPVSTPDVAAAAASLLDAAPFAAPAAAARPHPALPPLDLATPAAALRALAAPAPPAVPEGDVSGLVRADPARAEEGPVDVALDVQVAQTRVSVGGADAGPVFATRPQLAPALPRAAAAPPARLDPSAEPATLGPVLPASPEDARLPPAARPLGVPVGSSGPSLPPPPSPGGPASSVLVAAAGGFAIALAAALLYQRLARPDALRHEGRAALHAAVAARSAGATVGELGGAAGIPRKTAEYHLHYLLKLGLIRAHDAPGEPRRYLPVTGTPRVGADDALVALVREKPGLSTAQLAEVAGMTRTRADRRAKELVMRGALEARAVDGERRWFALA